jgi:hypothetical protein
MATLEPVKQWPLTSLKEKLIKTCAKAVSHGRYVALRMAEIAVSRELLQEILRLIDGLRPRPASVGLERPDASSRWEDCV